MRAALEHGAIRVPKWISSMSYLHMAYGMAEDRKEDQNGKTCISYCT